MARVGHRVDARPPSIDEGLRIARVRFDRRVRGFVAFAGHASIRLGLVHDHAAQLFDRLGDPRELRLVAVDDVLIRVVGVVLPHQPRARFVAQQRRQLVAVELLEQRQDVAHELCFSLHVMHTRVHGMALSRAGAMGSPQSRQIP